jgi:hypothetical protein
MTATATGNGWQHSGVVEVLLPSGYRVRGVLPTLRDLARRDLLSGALLEVATRGADPAWISEEGKTEEREAMRRAFTDELMAAFPREACKAGTDDWEPAVLTSADIENLSDHDQEMLERIVLRTLSVDDATRTSAVMLYGDPEEVAALIGWESFRQHGRRAEDSPDGASVERAAVDVAAGA